MEFKEGDKVKHRRGYGIIKKFCECGCGIPIVDIYNLRNVRIGIDKEMNGDLEAYEEIPLGHHLTKIFK